MTLEEKRAQARLIMKRQQAKQILANRPQEYGKVIDEMPEWLSTSDRMKAKNLTNNEDEQVAFLQKQYPDSEVRNVDGNVQLRKKGSKDWNVLDPSFSPFSNPMGTLKDLAADAGDIVSDIGMGAAEAAGAAAGAVGGLPGIMGGAAVGAGVASSAKEKLAEMLGVKQADYMNAAKDAAIGGLMPGAFKVAGAGLKAGAKSVAPKLYSKAIGVSEPLLKRMGEFTEEADPVTGQMVKKFKVDDIATRSSDETLGSIEGLQDTFGKGVKSQLDDVSAKYAANEAAGGAVDVRPIVQDIDQMILEAKQLADSNPMSGAFKDKLQELIKFRQKEIGPMGYRPKTMKLADASRLRNELSDRYLPKYREDIGQMVGKGVTPGDEKLAESMRRGLKDQMNVATGGKVGEIDSDFIRVNEIADFGRDYLSTPKKTIATIKKLGEGNDDELLGRFQRLPKEMQEEILTVQKDKILFDYLKKSNKNRVVTESSLGKAAMDSLIGQSPLEKALTLGGGMAGFGIGGFRGGAAGSALGKGAGSWLVRPERVKNIAKAGAKAGQKLDAMEALMERNPELLRLLYSSGAVTLQD